MTYVYDFRSCGEPGGWPSPATLCLNELEGNRAEGFVRNWWLQNCPVQSWTRKARALLNHALVCQVDGQTQKHWAWGANVLSDSALEDRSLLRTAVCSELIVHLQHFAFFLHFFLEGGAVFSPFAKAVTNLLSLVIDLAQSVREGSLALNCVHHKLCP